MRPAITPPPKATIVLLAGPIAEGRFAGQSLGEAFLREPPDDCGREDRAKVRIPLAQLADYNSLEFDRLGGEIQKKAEKLVRRLWTSVSAVSERSRKSAASLVGKCATHFGERRKNSSGPRANRGLPRQRWSATSMLGFRTTDLVLRGVCLRSISRVARVYCTRHDILGKRGTR